MTSYRDERFLFGHLWAVAGASLLLLICHFAEGTIADWAPGSFSLGTFFAMLAIVFPLFLLLWLVFFMFTWITAAIPILLTFLLAEKFNIRNVWYYLACGTLTAIVAMPLYAARGGTLPILAFHELWTRNAPWVVSCGAFGGFLYWWKAGRWAGVAPANPDVAVSHRIR